MGLTTAMYTGLSGMNANQARIATIGNNIANVNTHGFKGSRMLFQTQFAEVRTMGHAPNDDSGGSNPLQLGHGVTVGATQKNMNPGTVEATGIPSDLAIEGDGFFMVRRADNGRFYTRDGAFSLDGQNRLVSADGHALQGYSVDDTFSVVPNVLGDITLPVGTLSIVNATEVVRLDGDLSAAATVATDASAFRSQMLVNAGGVAANATTQLTELRSSLEPDTQLFFDGNTITVRGITKGEREVAPRDFVVGQDGNTLEDFANWLEGTLGIHKADDLAGDPGVFVENGRLVIRSNTGLENAISITGSDLYSDNAANGLPFSIEQTATANGEGMSTAFTVYDSLGSPVTLSISFALEALPGSGPQWRYYIEDPTANVVDRTVATGTIEFDNQGNFRDATNNTLTLDRSNTGAASPMQFNLDFASINGLSTKSSNVILGFQDGYPPGVLAGYGVGPDGTITGSFTNGETRTLGQVAVATFANPGGLVQERENLYSMGPNAGEPIVSAPKEFGAGAVIGGALEMSNVDLSNEFIGLITSSTGFQAASRVISTSNDMLDQLLLIIR